MENKQFTQIEDSVKALSVELTPVFNEIGELRKTLSEFKETKTLNALIELISRITKTARRHNIDTKVKLKDNQDEFLVGTNHNGLGYEQNYSSQLTDLTGLGCYYNNQTEREIFIRKILFNKEAVVDLTEVIKKSNQKTFLKIVNILKKYNLNLPFAEYQEKEIDYINIDTDNDDYKIKIDLSRSGLTTFLLNNELLSGSVCVDFGNSNNKPELKILEETNEKLADISKHTFKNLNLNEVKLCFFLTKHKESIINEIKASRTLLNDAMKHYTDEQNELNELLQPILTLEKL